MDKKGVYFLCLHTHPQTHLQRMLNIILFITLHLAVGLWYMRMYIYICLYSYYFRNYKYRHNITYVTYVVYMLFTIYYILNHMITYILSVNLVCAIYPCIIPITI